MYYNSSTEIKLKGRFKILLDREEIKNIYNKDDCIEMKDLIDHSFECNYYERNGRIVKMTHTHKILFAFKKAEKIYLKYKTWEGEFWVIGNGKTLIRNTEFIFKNALNKVKREEKI